MELITFGSSSAGNGYALVANDGECLLIEAGIPLSEVTRVVSVGRIVGCLCSHRHRDHAAYIHDVNNMGVDVFAPQEVFEGRRAIIPSFCHAPQLLRKRVAGRFTFFPFSCFHDVVCYGYVISHPDMGNLLFATDTMAIEYRFKGLNHVMIECNYADDILDRNILAGIYPPQTKARLMKTHMELSVTRSTLLANDLSNVRDIILIHLSPDNSNADVFRDKIQADTGIPTFVARKGFRKELSIQPY